MTPAKKNSATKSNGSIRGRKPLEDARTNHLPVILSDRALAFCKKKARNNGFFKRRPNETEEAPARWVAQLVEETMAQSATATGTTTQVAITTLDYVRYDDGYQDGYAIQSQSAYIVRDEQGQPSFKTSTSLWENVEEPGQPGGVWVIDSAEEAVQDVLTIFLTHQGKAYRELAEVLANFGIDVRKDEWAKSLRNKHKPQGEAIQQTQFAHFHLFELGPNTKAFFMGE
jgi:hypothetical protein